MSHENARWIAECEKRGVNPYQEAMEWAVCATQCGDRKGAAKMAAMAICMMESGYHKQAKETIAR